MTHNFARFVHHGCGPSHAGQHITLQLGQKRWACRGEKRGKLGDLRLLEVPLVALVGVQCLVVFRRRQVSHVLAHARRASEVHLPCWKINSYRASLY